MTDARAFGVETVHVDLPALAGALGQRLHAAGVPMTPGRLTDLARALTVARQRGVETTVTTTAEIDNG